MAYTIQTVGLGKSFGAHSVLHGVDLAVPDGTVFALLGANGAGKTTLVRILATLLRPDVGTATVAGHDLLTDPLGVRRSISLTGQFAAVDDLLTGRENLELMARLRRVPRRTVAARTTELLSAFGLVDAADRRVATYSGGMVRRLDLALSLIERPQLLFLDEPTTGLDPHSRDQLWAAVHRLVADGVSVLLTTQYLQEADQLADTIGLLAQGRIVAQGSADDLKASLGAEVVRLRFDESTAYERAVALFATAHADRQLRVLDVATTADVGDVHAILERLTRARLGAASVSMHRPSLDDVFRSLTGPDGTGAAATETHRATYAEVV